MKHFRVILLIIFTLFHREATAQPVPYKDAGVWFDTDPYGWVGEWQGGSAFPVSQNLCLSAAHVAMPTNGNSGEWVINQGYRPQYTSDSQTTLEYYPIITIGWSSYSSFRVDQDHGNTNTPEETAAQWQYDESVLLFANTNGHDSWPTL